MPLGLRALDPSDEARIREIAEDADVRLWNPITGPDYQDWMTRQSEPSEQHVTWAIEEGGTLLGVMSLFHLDHEQGTGELGYRVHPGARGRGVATQALLAARTHGFGELGLRRLELFHAVANPASCTVAERAGFRLEGTLRESYVYGDGQAHDEHLHACLESDEGP